MACRVSAWRGGQTSGNEEARVWMSGLQVTLSHTGAMANILGSTRTCEEWRRASCRVSATQGAGGHCGLTQHHTSPGTGPPLPDGEDHPSMLPDLPGTSCAV